MTFLATLYQLMIADVRERTRRPSFLVSLLVALYLGYLYLPDAAAGYVTVSVSHARGIYNSAWVGAVGSIMSSAFLSIIGFYLVKNAIERDRQTGVGQILAATPMSRFQYLMSKALSNFTVLASIQGAVVAAVALMQVVRGESNSIDMIDLVAPSVCMVLPFLSIVAATAVLFEVVPFLRGALGNVIFYFMWTFILVTSFTPSLSRDHEAIIEFNDPAGVTQLMHSISVYAKETLGLLDGNISAGVHIVKDAHSYSTFEWPGMTWTMELVAGRMLWFLAAIGIVGMTVPLFDRFGSTSSVKKIAEKNVPNDRQEPAPAPSRPVTRLSTLTQPLVVRLGTLVKAELILVWRSIGRWWLIAATVMSLIMLFVPLSVSRQWLLPIAWIWPLGIWSSMGVKEREFRTEQMLFSVAGACEKRLLSIWISGVLVAFFCVAGIAVRFVLAGDIAGIMQLATGALFITALALACGTWSGGTRLFEGLYIAIWYAGPMNHAAPLDFIGVRQESWAEGITAIYAAATVILMILAVLGRKRQMRRL